MQALNIVNLIESNPITKLTNVYNNRFLAKIQENFTETEQQLFISSCYCYLNYDQNADFVIDLDNVWNWLGFQHKAKAKSLLEKHFVIDKDYKKILDDNAKQKTDIEKKHGGHNKEIFMLTVKCFKLFCIKADTKKAKEIHEYFIKLEEILQQIIHEECNEFKLQLETAKNTIISIEETKTKDVAKSVALERERQLLREFGTTGPIVYIIKVKAYENGTYIIKIGESRKGIQSRYNEHKTHYGDILLLDCFSVKNSKDFETFIHTHNDIKFSRVTDLAGHEKEREIFLVGKNLSYKTVLHIINSNIKQFNEFKESELEKAIAENESLKQIIAQRLQPNNDNNIRLEMVPESNDLLNQILKTVQNLEKTVQNLEKSNKEISDKLNALQTKTTTNFNTPLVTVGPRLQQINEETLTINKVYESVAECLKEYNFKVKRPSIDKAIIENTIYYGFRWAYVDRDKDPNIITNIEPTKPTKIQNVGYIAKLNKEKTEIINVYLDRKIACSENNYKSLSALDNHVKNETLTNGHYYVLFHKCTVPLQQDFIQLFGEPILYKDGVGQFNSDNQLHHEFVCKYDAIKQLKISDKTLAKVIDKNVLYNNYYYKHIGSKIKCV